MKNAQQQELCRLIDEFYKNKGNDTFQRLVGGLFRCPLLFPMMRQQDGKKQFLMAERENTKVFTAFTDMEEALKGKLEKVDFVPFTLEEYSAVVARAEVESLIINLFSEKNCMINKSFFADVICKAFEENRVMPALRPAGKEEYIPVHKFPFTIGRSAQADLVIEDQTINGLHGILIEKDKKYYIVDKNSLNGICVNGKQLEPGGEQQIFFDDVIEFCDAEYTFVPIGLAQREEPSVYDEDDRTMIANAMYVMQRRLIPNEFFKNTENFLKALTEDENQENYRRYFLIGLEMTCDMREKALGITDRDVIERQRRRMLGKGMYIFQKGDYGFRQEEYEKMQVYVIEFPQLLHIHELSKRIYLLVSDAGDKAVYVSRIVQERTSLIKITGEQEETDLGEAPQNPEEELAKVIGLGV